MNGSHEGYALRERAQGRCHCLRLAGSHTVLRTTKSPIPSGLEGIQIYKQVSVTPALKDTNFPRCCYLKNYNCQQHVLYLNSNHTFTKTAPVRLEKHGPLELLARSESRTYLDFTLSLAPSSRGNSLFIPSRI